MAGSTSCFVQAAVRDRLRRGNGNSITHSDSISSNIIDSINSCISAV